MKNASILVLSLLVIGLGSYVIFDKVASKYNNDNKTSCIKKIESNENHENLNTEQSAINYKTYSDNVVKQMNNYYYKSDDLEIDVWKNIYLSEFINIREGNNQPVLSIQLKTNGDVYANFEREPSYDKEKQLYSKYGSSYKLSSDIIDVYVVPEGNGGHDASIYLINRDGTLKRIYYSIIDTTEYKIEDNYKDLKNLVYISYHASLGSTSKYATDIYGNFYDLN